MLREVPVDVTRNPSCIELNHWSVGSIPYVSPTDVPRRKGSPSVVHVRKEDESSPIPCLREEERVSKYPRRVGQPLDVSKSRRSTMFSKAPKSSAFGSGK